MNGRAYAITFANGAPASDTLVFASDRMETVGRVAVGFMAAPYTCTEADSLRITAEMSDSSQVLRWSANIFGDEVLGTMTLLRSDGAAGAISAFTGRALAGTDATLRTPQRQVERL
ncbi:MAG: hypothetical protein WAU70_05795 [Flavobacteriales bacterium]